MLKNDIRALMKNRREQLSESQRKAYNKKISERLFALDHFKECRMLFSYVSFGSEADTTTVIKTALEMNKRVFIPKVEDKEMNFYAIYSLDGLIRSKFGILEPSGSDRPYLPDHNDDVKKIMLLPGLAFDKTGNRIGYGAGYYDRYLGRFPENEWLKIGIAFSFQIMENLPASDKDIRTDFIITDEELILCNEYNKGY